MEIAVLGGGNGCYAAAAHLAEAGHNVRFWRRDAEAFKPVLEAGAVRVKDGKGVRDAKLALATTELGNAVAGADLIVMPLPATTQRAMADALAPLLTDGQIVFMPPGTLGSYLMAKWIREAGNTSNLAFAEAGTLPYLTRKHTDGSIAISARTTRLPTGVFPARLTDKVMAVIREAYPEAETRADALDAALLNHGPMIHPPLILLNAGPLQHFEHWDIHNEGTQPFIRSVTTALEQERINLREHLGYAAPHFPLSDHYARGKGDEPMYGSTGHEQLVDSGDWREDIDLHAHRYMMEDIKYGLALFVTLCEWASVPCPVARGLLAIAAAGTEEDFLETGRSWESCGLAGLDIPGVRRLMNDGF